MIVSIPLRLDGGPNRREHWAARAKRTKHERWLVGCALRSHRGGNVWVALARPRRDDVSFEVTLTRIAPRAVDDDNLRGRLKAVRDAVADFLGLASDADPRVMWCYAQRRLAVPRTYAVEIQIV